MGERDMRRRLTKVLILASILVLPGFLYHLLQEKGSNNYIALPVFGEKTLTGTFTSRMGEQIPDTLYHQVPVVALTNQAGKLVKFPAVDSSISIVNFFYTRCDAFCDLLNNEMNRVAERFINNPRVRFYSLTVDPAYDVPAVLADYSVDRYSPASKKWDFLTSMGDAAPSLDDPGAVQTPEGQADVLELARRGLLVDAIQDTTREAAFIHSSSLILMDSRRRIRGYYDVTHRKEVDRLIDEVKLLLVEEVRLKASAKIEQQ